MIARLIAKKHTITSIAGANINIKSLIINTITRNTDARNREYQANLAQRKANLRHKQKPKKIAFNQEAGLFIQDYLTFCRLSLCRPIPQLAERC